MAILLNQVVGIFITDLDANSDVARPSKWMDDLVARVTRDPVTSREKPLYGFRSGHSTEHAALELTDRIITNIDNKKVHQISSSISRKLFTP